MLQKLIAISLGVFFIAGFLTTQKHELTYAEQAKKSLTSKFDDVIDNIEDFNDKSEPKDSKNLRKNIAELREQLDLFVYAYPFNHQKDQWIELRRDLDIGHEQVNAFKELENSKDLEEVNVIRKAILEWKEKFLGQEKSNFAYLKNPSQEITYVRSKNLLSKFFWGVSLVDADVTKSTGENFTQLIVDLANQAQADIKTIKKISQPTHDLSPRQKNTKTLHNFRMRIRSLAKLFRSQPNLKQVLTGNFTPKLETLVTKYSELNERIEEHERLVKQGKFKSAHSLEADLKSDWKELIQYQKEMSVLDFLQAISGEPS